MLWPLLLCAVACLAAVLRLLLSYGDRSRCAWYVQAAAAASWYLPLTIVFILPFDFSSALYRICDGPACNEPLGYITSHFTRHLWAALYWSMYLLTWLVLPLMMAYVDSGAFSVRDRLRDSAWSNLQFYGIGGAVGLLVVSYIALTRGVFGADLVAFLMALANFWGLFLVITFMGFGLVSIPRALWLRGDLERELSLIESRATAFKDSAYDSGLELSDVVAEVRLAAARISAADDLRPCVCRVLARCPAPDPARPPLQSAAPASRVPAEISEQYLARLHNRIKRVVMREERDRWRWTRAARRAFFLQDALASRANPTRQLVSTLHPWRNWSLARRAAAWWWYVALRPVVFRVLAAIAAVLSVAILWSELTFNVAEGRFSPIRHALRALGLSSLAIESASISIIAYMSLCAYSSVMRLRIFNIYSLEAHHHTSERSLLFCGAYLCRLMFPLCYNFLNMAGSGSDITEFARFMDQIDLVPVLGEQSNRAIPVLIMVPAALAFFNVHGRVAEYFSIDRQGRALLLEARRAAEHQQGTADLRRFSPVNSINFRGSVPSLTALADPLPPPQPQTQLQPPANAVRGPREWHLGRPSLDHLRNQPSAAAAATDQLQDPPPSLPNIIESHLPAAQLVNRFGSSGDLLNIGVAGSPAPDAAAGSDSSDSSNSDPHPPSGSTAQSLAAGRTPSTSSAAGVAARFGRWLPPRSGMPRTVRAKAPSTSRPANSTRLRPSSRQSSRHDASDDGATPDPFHSRLPTSAYAGTFGRLASTRSAARASHAPLLQSPSSPGRTANPWADNVRATPAQPRRHALSDSSMRAPAAADSHH
ncbi:hypothetical protein GGF46_001137 [Coemansia sp. RSA 552]|nr:hypothetical protein GGF46_001137 [Coemansia sp. RSA 552]